VKLCGVERLLRAERQTGVYARELGESRELQLKLRTLTRIVSLFNPDLAGARRMG
jgi:hypothetical protein